MKLELKHLAPYLPYGLRLRQPVLRRGFRTRLMTVNNILDTIERQDIIKPILRPLSDLSKDINIDGNKINPLKIILKHHEFYNSIKFIQYDNDSYIEMKGHAMITEVYSVDDSPLKIAEKLFAWHFDVFGLIEKGLAIDINTLK